MQKFKAEITVQVADSWIADGFNLEEWKENIESSIKSFLPYAYDHEVRVKVKITTERPKALKALQSGEVEPRD